MCTTPVQLDNTQTSQVNEPIIFAFMNIHVQLQVGKKFCFQFSAQFQATSFMKFKINFPRTYFADFPKTIIVF